MQRGEFTFSNFHSISLQIQHQRALMSSLGAFGAGSVKKRFHHRYHLRHNASEKWQMAAFHRARLLHANATRSTHRISISLFSLLGMKRERAGWAS
jgi:uncharacterized membrane protein YgdD (TMEM256/DUF423 family)